MKTQSIVIFILFAIGCRQCSSSAIAAALDPLSILRPDPSALLLPPRASVEIAPLITQADGSIVDVALRALDQPIILPGELQANNQPNILRRTTDGVKKFVQSVGNVIKKILSIPLSIIKILLLPITVTYNVIKFFLKLFFLPITIGWKILKALLFPVKLILQKLLSPNPDPTPQFVYGVPSSHLYGPPLFAA